MANTMGLCKIDEMSLDLARLKSESMKAKIGAHETKNTITTDIIKTVTFRAVRVASAC